MKSLLFATLAVLTSAAQAADPTVAFPQPTGQEFARTTPYSLVGQLLFKSGARNFSGSGTVIRPSSIITAGHNLYDLVHGRSTNLVFNRSQYGNTNLGEKVPNRLLILGGYRAAVTEYGS